MRINLQICQLSFLIVLFLLCLSSLFILLILPNIRIFMNMETIDCKLASIKKITKSCNIYKEECIDSRTSLCLNINDEKCYIYYGLFQTQYGEKIIQIINVAKYTTNKKYNCIIDKESHSIESIKLKYNDLILIDFINEIMVFFILITLGLTYIIKILNCIKLEYQRINPTDAINGEEIELLVE